MHRRLMGLATGLMLAACSSMEVSVDYDPSVPLTSLRTYSWKPEPQQKAGDTLVDTDTLLRQRVITSLENELTRKGYSKIGRKPDFRVGFFFTRQLKMDETYPYPYGGYFGGPYYGYWGGWLYPGYPGFGPGTIREFEEGLLVIDFVDPETDRLLWRGKVKDILRFQESPETRSRRIQKAVSAVLERFPPGPSPH
jgi:hypothetical protein